MPDSLTPTTAPTIGHIRADEPTPGALWLTVDRAHKHNALARPVLAELAASVRAAVAPPPPPAPSPRASNGQKARFRARAD